MQLNTEIIVFDGRNRWIVTIDGVREPGIGYGCREMAYARMNELWAQRSQSDRTLEALYVGRD